MVVVGDQLEGERVGSAACIFQRDSTYRLRHDVLRRNNSIREIFEVFRREECHLVMENPSPSSVGSFNSGYVEDVEHPPNVTEGEESC